MSNFQTMCAGGLASSRRRRIKNTYAVRWRRRWRRQRQLWTPTLVGHNLLTFSAIITETITIVCQVVSLTKSKITRSGSTRMASKVGGAAGRWWRRGRSNLNQILCLFAHHQFPIDFLSVRMSVQCFSALSSLSNDGFLPDTTFLFDKSLGRQRKKRKLHLPPIIMQYYCIKSLSSTSFPSM